MTQKVVVIGGGIAGLIAAWRLKQAGQDVLLLEASERLGGAICTHIDGAWKAELGPNTMPDRDGVLDAIIKELGLEQERIYPNTTSKKRFIIKNGQLLALPTSPGALWKSNLLSLGAKVRLLKEPLIPKQCADVQEDENLAAFATRRLGQEVLDYMIDPFVAGTFAGTPCALSVKHAFPRLERLEREHGSIILGGIKSLRQGNKKSPTSHTLVNFEQGVHTLTSAIAKRIKECMTLNAPVSRIQRIHNNSSWLITYGAHAQETVASSIVLAIPAHAISSITIINAQDEKIDTSCFDHSLAPPMTLFALGYPKHAIEHPLDGFGMLAPSVEKRRILGAIFASTIFERRAPPGHELLIAFVGGARQPKIAQKTIQEQLHVVKSELKDLLGIRSDPVFCRHRHWSKSFPQYTVGYGSFKQAVAKHEQDNKGLFFTGNYLVGLSVPDVIQHAQHTVLKV